MDFCLIHLSDFHLRTSTQAQTDRILSSLAADAKERVRQLDLPDPHIALSGDLAYGGRDEEYAIVDGFVDGLVDSLHARSTVFCGGNHDVNWALLSPLSAEMMNDMVEKRDGMATAQSKLENDADRDVLAAGMGPYYSFLKRRGIESSADYYYVKTLTVSSISLNLVSLNSAFAFSRKYNYHGYLGKRQLESIGKELSSQRSPSFNITLVHHPLEAIVPSAQEETKRHLFAFSDVVLNGHVHSPRVSIEYTARLLGQARHGPPPVVCCSRCVFDEANDPTVSSGYYLLGLDFEYERVSGFKVWEVLYDKGKGEWYSDESRQTYPMVVKIPAPPGGGIAGASTVGPKVTDEERSLLKKWKTGKD